MRTTKTKKATSLLLTSLALTLTFNPIISYAALIQLPDKITNVKYPDEIQQLIMKASISNDINEIFSDKNISKLNNLEVSEDNIDGLIEGLLEE